MSMFPLNPMSSSILQTGQVQRTQAAEKDRQARRITEMTKNVALADDRLEHQVESSDTAAVIGDEQKKDQQPREKKKHHPKDDEEGSQLDVRG